MLRAAFIFVAPESDPAKHRTVVTTPVVELTVVGVADYEGAAREAATLAEQGIVAIELCAGFGTEGVAVVKRAVGAKAAVGAVRFDYHPGLEFKSGDDIFCPAG